MKDAPAVVMLDDAGRVAGWTRRAEPFLAGDDAFAAALAEAARATTEEQKCVLARSDGTPVIARMFPALGGGAGAPTGGWIILLSPGSVAGKYFEAFQNADVVLQSIAEGVSVQDASGRLLYANDAAARLCGFKDAQEMLSTRPEDILACFEVLDESGAPIDPARLPGRRALLGEDPEPMLVRVRQRAGGGLWWSQIRASAIHDDAGRPELAVNLWHDVTRTQRRAEVARILAESARRLAASLDYESTLAAVAQSLVPELADWSSVELVEGGVRKTLAVAHADPEKIAFARRLSERYPPDPDATTGAANVLRTGRAELWSDIPEELLRASAVDEEHWRMIEELGLRSAIIVPIPVAGRTEGVLSLVSAESGRRYDDDDFELACEIGRRAGTAIEHARAYQAAQRAIDARDDFLSVAGHELRTPLAALSLQLETLKAALDSGRLEKERDKYAARIEKSLGQVARLGKLVDDLLDVARVSTGRLALEPTTVDLAEIVRETATRLSEVAARAGSAISVDAPAPVVGAWDPRRLEQVVANLVGNAVKYGEGKPIEVSCAARGTDAALVVRDHGIGIAAADQDRVFRRFERAVPEANYAGLGLGLWIVREIVEAHGGRISLASEPGRGTTFEVVLPLR